MTKTFLCWSCSLILLLLLGTPRLHACSAFVLKDNSGQIFVGKNFDWTLTEGMVIVNPRNVPKQAYLTHLGKVVQWSSRYGSISFNQNGLSMPYGGINEARLVVEMLWLEDTRYPEPRENPYLNELEWIQYQLDQFATVADVIANLHKIDVYPVKGKVHYMVADSTGASAIVEFLGGKVLHYPFEKLQCHAITNKSQLVSEKYKHSLKKIRKNNTAPTYRYHQLEKALVKLKKQKSNSLKQAVSLLEDVRIKKGDFRTRWSIVYNLKTGEIHYYSDLQPNARTLRISEFDFNLITPQAESLTWNETSPIPFPRLNEELNREQVRLSLMHLGFDSSLCDELSRHQFGQIRTDGSIYIDNYLHLDLILNLDTNNQRVFVALFDSPEAFEAKRAVAGSYVYMKIPVEEFKIRIYGLPEGKYALLSFIDLNKNRYPDLNEPFLSLNPKLPSAQNKITFSDCAGIITPENPRFVGRYLLRK